MLPLAAAVVLASILVLARIDPLAVFRNTLPALAERCAVRYAGADVTVHFEGSGVEASCGRWSSTGLWTVYVGPGLGGLACHDQRGDLKWNVYDTDLMLFGRQVCEELAVGL